MALNSDSNKNSCVNDINDAGDVVGWLVDNSTNEWSAVLWEVSGTTVTQHLLAGGTQACGTQASGVNELQQVVGTSGGDAAYWESVSSPALILPALASPGSGAAFELNDQGVIVGRSRNAESVDVPVVWRVVGGVPSGPFVLPGGEGEATDLTNDDDTGVATIAGQANFRPVTWTVRSEADGSFTLLSGPDDVDPDAVGYGEAFSINALGDVCGEFCFTQSSEGDSAVRAWNGGGLEILGQLNQRQTDDINYALCINDAGQAVGWDRYTTKQGGWKATVVLWAIDGSAKELVKLVTGWNTIRYARGINNQGVIAAEGQLAPYGAEHALVMIPPQ